MESSVHFIVNPWAGKKTDRAEDKILEYARRHSLSWQIDICKEKYSIRALTAKAIDSGASCIVAVGGDGTLNEISAVLMNTDVALGILPFGTGNDFIRSANIPGDIEKALDIIRNRKVSKIDMGTLNGEPFINISSIGFAADVNVNLIQFKHMNMRGLLAYLAATLKTAVKLDKVVSDIDFYDIELIPELGENKFISSLERLDFSNYAGSVHRVRKHKWLLIAACNGRSFGGGMNVAPCADLSDAYFDICLVHDANRRDLVTILPGFIKGKHIHNKRICAYFRAKGFKMSVSDGVNIERDGEVRNATDIEVMIHPKALKIIIA